MRITKPAATIQCGAGSRPAAGFQPACQGLAKPVLNRLFPLAALILFAATAHAEGSQERAQRVIQAAIAALGGNAFLSLENRTESGRVYAFYREKLTGLASATIYTKYVPVADPHALAVAERDSFVSKNKSTKEDYANLFTDKGAWDISYRGVRPLPEDRLPRYKESARRNVFYIMRLRMHEPGMLFESRGADVMDNRPVEIVDITDGDNDTTTVYFDQTTRLPMRQIFYRRDPETKDKDEEVTIFAKYRDVGGVQWPFDVQRMRNGEIIFQIYADSVKINQSLPDTLFELPSGATMLKAQN
jgi:hypothetical protein